MLRIVNVILLVVEEDLGGMSGNKYRYEVFDGKLFDYLRDIVGSEVSFLKDIERIFFRGNY